MQRITTISADYPCDANECLVPLGQDRGSDESCQEGQDVHGGALALTWWYADKLVRGIRRAA